MKTNTAFLLESLEGSLAQNSCWRGKVDWVEEVDSTNEQVLALLKQGKQAPFALLAERQTQGRGQRGRKWVGFSGESILLSAALLGPKDLSARELASFVVGEVLAKLAATFGIVAEVKLPNDLLIAGAKCAGVLIEATTASRALCVGIGLNVTQSRQSLQDAVDQKATSLACHAKVLPPRPVLAAMLLEELAESFQPFSLDSSSS